MTKNLKPITLPIDPAKAHLYVARNGVGVVNIVKVTKNTDSDSAWDYFFFKNGAHTGIFYSTGLHIGYNLGVSPYDLTHEIITEPEAQGLDWSEVILKIWDTAHSYKTGYRTISQFENKVLAILQEFEREWLQTTPVCIDVEKDNNKPDESGL